MPDFTLYEGDCLEVLPKLEKGSVQFSFCDLPYAVTRNSWDLAVIDPALFWQNIKPCQHDQAVTVLTAEYRFGALMIAANVKNFRYDLVWHKPNRATGFLNARRMPLRSHEHCLVFCSTATIYNPVMTSGAPWRVSPPNTANNGSNYGHYEKKHQTNSGTRMPTSVLSIRCDYKKRIHPTQKPVALLEWFIATYTNPGDSVLDPCMGSGTTGHACANLGRRFIGIEKDATYFAAAKARIEKAYAEAAAGPKQGRLAV